MGILGVVIFAILTVLSGLWYGDWFKALHFFKYHSIKSEFLGQLSFMIEVVHVGPIPC